MIVETAQAPRELKAARQQPRRISKEEFLEEYANREDGYKYEWNNGIVEKTESMNQQQTTLFLLLSRLFLQTAAFKNGGGLVCETDVDTTETKFRRPDILFFSGDQIPGMKRGENQIPAWVAEVISPSDKADDIDDKVEEYFRAGVQVVWNIYPHSKKVEVYTAPDHVTVCRGKTICSGAPALPDFQITAEELFA